MKIVDSVAKAISDWQSGDLESAMIHACNAVDGTAQRAYPKIKGNNLQFTTLIRDNYSILGPMALHGIDPIKSRYGVTLENPKASGGKPDVADIIYGIHRCSHNHGQELPDGYELISSAGGLGFNGCRVDFTTGKVQLSEQIIFGLLAIVVFSTVNGDQKTSNGYYLSYNNHVFPINDWWGRVKEFLVVVDNEPPSVVTITEYGDDGFLPVHMSTELHIKIYGKGHSDD